MAYVKIKNIKYIGKQKVMDICVPETENFILGNKILSHNSSIRPLQPKFHHMLAKGEKPEGMEIITLRPTFFKSLREPYNELPSGNTWYSVKLNEMVKGDFMMLMGASELTPNQRISLEEIWDEIQKLPNFESLDQVDCIIDQIEDQSEGQIASMKRKFKPLRFANFFDNNYAKDIIPAINDNVTFAINMENFESFGREYASYPQVFMTIFLRKIIQARRRKMIPGIFIFIDEASRFIPQDESSITTLEIKECLEENTLIKTSNGDKKIKDLDEKKDLIFAYDFNLNEIIISPFHKFRPKKYNKKIIEITTEDGKIIECSFKHRLFVKRNGIIIKIEAQYLIEGDELASL